LRRLIGDLLKNRDISFESEARAKDVNSLKQKIATKGYSNLDELPDLAGVRIVVKTLSDVTAVVNMLEQEFKVVEDVPHGGVDSISESFGYASRHIVLTLKAPRSELEEYRRFKELKCEVQMRTILQHAWASISHYLLYKSVDDIPRQIKRTMSQMSAIIEVGDGLFQKIQHDVSELRTEYKADAESGDWRGLKIDLDSLVSTWERWRPRWMLAPTALEGFPHMRVIDGALVTGEEEYPNPEYISAIVGQAKLRDLDTIGQLADFTDSQAFRKGVTFHLKRTTPESGGGLASLDFLTAMGMYAAQ